MQKKCCIFSLKCLDVNNLIHNFVTQVKIGCTLAKPIFAPKAKIGYTSAKLTSKLASSALGLHYLYPKTPTERRRTNCIFAVARTY